MWLNAKYRINVKLNKKLFVSYENVKENVLFEFVKRYNIIHLVCRHMRNIRELKCSFLCLWNRCNIQYFIRVNFPNPLIMLSFLLLFITHFGIQWNSYVCFMSSKWWWQLIHANSSCKNMKMFKLSDVFYLIPNEGNSSNSLSRITSSCRQEISNSF